MRGLWSFLLVSMVTARAAAEPERGYHGRLEAQSSWTWGEGDPRMERWGPSAGVRYYLRDVLALGVDGVFFTHNADGDFNFQVRRATRVTMPLDEYQWQAQFTVTYAFLHGGWRILHFDAYGLAGAGVLSARPVPVFDPDNRKFDFRPSATFGLGLGLRFFISRWFATSLEVRDFAWCGHHESDTITSDPSDRAAWYGPATFNDNLQLVLGFSLFAPL